MPNINISPHSYKSETNNVVESLVVVEYRFICNLCAIMKCVKLSAHYSINVNSGLIWELTMMLNYDRVRNKKCWEIPSRIAILHVTLSRNVWNEILITTSISVKLGLIHLWECLISGINLSSRSYKWKGVLQSP